MVLALYFAVKNCLMYTIYAQAPRLRFSACARWLRFGDSYCTVSMVFAEKRCLLLLLCATTATALPLDEGKWLESCSTSCKYGVLYS